MIGVGGTGRAGKVIRDRFLVGLGFGFGSVRREIGVFELAPFEATPTDSAGMGVYLYQPY